MKYSINENVNGEIKHNVKIDDINTLTNLENNLEVIKTFIYEKPELNFYSVFYKIKSTNQHFISLYFNKFYEGIEIKLLDFMKLKNDQDFLNYTLNILSKIICIENEPRNQQF